MGDNSGHQSGNPSPFQDGTAGSPNFTRQMTAWLEISNKKRRRKERKKERKKETGVFHKTWSVMKSFSCERFDRELLQFLYVKYFNCVAEKNVVIVK